MHSLRGRLTLWTTAVLAAVLALAGVIAAHDVDRSERAALDDRLIRTAQLSGPTALQAVQNELPSGDERLDAVLAATGTSLRLTLGGTTLVETGQRVPDHDPLKKGFTSFSSRGVPYRAYVTNLRDPSLGGLARLELTTSLTALEQRQDKLRNRLLLVGLLAVALAALGVFLAGRVVLRPLSRLRAAAARIAGEEDLGQRVPADRGPKETRSLAAAFNAMLARLSQSAADRERAIEATRRFAADAGHEPLDLADALDVALAAARDRHPGVGWSTDVPDGAVTIDAWAPGLRSLLDSLLENAARHGRAEGGMVQVSLRRRDDDGAAELVIEDDGPGISSEDRERIFEPFVRVGDKEEGSGLGLALVAQQARHHGATVEVERSPSLGGARFVVRFPPAGGRQPADA